MYLHYSPIQASATWLHPCKVRQTLAPSLDLSVKWGEGDGGAWPSQAPCEARQRVVPRWYRQHNNPTWSRGWHQAELCIRQGKAWHRVELSWVLHELRQGRGQCRASPPPHAWWGRRWCLAWPSWVLCGVREVPSHSSQSEGSSAWLAQDKQSSSRLTWGEDSST